MKIAKCHNPDKSLRRYLLKTGRLMSQPRYAAQTTPAKPLTLTEPPWFMKHPTRLMTGHITFRYGRSQPLVYGPQQRLIAAYSTQVPPAAYVTPNTLPKEHDPQ